MKPFRFKQFEIAHDRCAMKVGTDGVLLGAWTPLADERSILDIGAGSGVIAMMMAQRSYAETIDGIELDEESYEQCVENFENSPWPDRLFCYHADLLEFTQELDETYDLIVSNPPFYTANYTSGDEQRDTARQNSALPFEILFACVKQLLNISGKASLIFSYENEAEVLKTAASFDLFPEIITRVKGNATAPTKRSLVLFGQSATETIIDELIIEIDRHVHTPQYSELVKDFYL